MSVYTAKKVNPRIDGDLFKVDVQIFDDGRLVRVETFETTQEQGADWPADGIKQLIGNLQDVPTMLGKVTAGDVVIPSDQVIDMVETSWQNDLSKAKAAKSLIDIGILLADNELYIALLVRLKKDFKPEYIGLI